MALKIEIDTKGASAPVTNLNKSLDDLAKKLEEIKVTFNSLNVSKLKEATTQLDAFNKVKASNEQAKSVMALNKALTVQIEELKKVTKAKQAVAESEKKSTNGTKEKTAALTELEKIQKKANQASERMAVINLKEGEVLKALILTIEREKLAMEQVTLAVRAQVLADQSRFKGKATLLAQSKAEIDHLNRLNDAKARAAVVSKSSNQRDLKKIELSRLLILETEKLAKLEAEKAIAQARTSGTTAKAIADARAKNNQLTLETERTRLNNQAIKEAIALQAKKAHFNSEEARKVRTLRAELDALNGTNKKVSNSNKKVATSTKEVSTAMADGNRRAAEFRAALSAMGLSFGIFTGSTIVMAATVFGIVKSLRSAIEAGAEFEFTMDRVNAVMNTTPSQAKALEESVRSLAETTIFTAGEVSKGLVFLGMAGFDSAEALQALEPTLRLAQIGMIGMEQAADLVTNIMAGFNLQAFEMTETVDKLSVVVTSSNTSITQLAQALSFVGPAAANTNTSLEETTAILGFFGNVGIKATRAGTALRRGIANISNPTDKVRKVMGDLGINIIGTNGLMRSMADIIGELSEKGATMSQIFSIFGTRAGAAFAAAIRNGTGEIQALVKAQEDAEGTSKKLANVLEDNAWTDFKLVVSAIHETLITFYDGLDGPVRSALGGAIKLFKGATSILKEFSGELKFAVLSLISLGSAMALVKLGAFLLKTKAASAALLILTNGVLSATFATQAAAVSLAALKTAFTFLTGPIGLVLGAIGLVSAGFALANKESKALTQSLEDQKNSMEDLNVLKSKIGLKSTDTGVKALDELNIAIAKLDDPTIGELFSKKLLESSKFLHEAKRNLHDVRKNLFGKADPEEVKRAEDLVASAEMQLNLVKVAKRETGELGTKLGIAAIETKTIVELNSKQLEIAKQELRLKKEKENKDLTALANARKLKALKELDLQIEKAKSGEEVDLIKENDKIRKAELGKLFKILSSTTGDDSAIVAAIQDIFSERASDIGTLGAEAKALETSIAALRKTLGAKGNETQAEDFGQTLGKGRIKVMEDAFAKFRELTQKDTDAKEKLKQILNANEIKAEAEKLRFTGELRRIAAAKELSSMEEDAKRQSNALQFRFDADLISLREYAETTQTIHNDLIEDHIKLLNKEKAAQVLVLSVLKETKDPSVALNKEMETYNKSILELTLNIEKLKSSEMGKIELDNKVKDTVKDRIDDATKYNISLREQIALLGRGNELKKSSNLISLESTIASVNALKGTRHWNEGIKELLVTLNELHTSITSNEAKIREIGETWDEASNNMEGKALSAAKSMQDQLTEFFIDPSKQGFDDLADHFAKTVQRMLAEQLAQRLFNGADGKGGGLGDFSVKFFGSVLGQDSSGATNTSADYTGDAYQNWLGNNATGGSFRVAGSGGIDSELVNLRATPGEIVTISNPNGGDDNKMSRMGGGDQFHNVVNVNVGAGVNKEEVRVAVNTGLMSLEAKLVNQNRRRGKPAGVR